MQRGECSNAETSAIETGMIYDVTTAFQPVHCPHIAEIIRRLGIIMDQILC